MGTVFRKTSYRPVPASAELAERKGERVARWRSGGKMRTAPVVDGRDGRPRVVVVSPYFTAKYRDGRNVVVEDSTGCRDETAARQVLARLERAAELIRAGVMTADEAAAADHQGTPFDEHVGDYAAHLRAAERDRVHQENTVRYLRRLARECSFARLPDITREALERWLDGRAGEGMSARSRNAHRNALVAFCNWAVDAGRLTANPAARAPKADERADPRRRRRAMTEDELRRLLDVASRRPLLDALTVRTGKATGQAIANVRPEVQARLVALGRERALVYKTLVLTGLRKGELASLTVAQADLDAVPPALHLEAADEKNAEGNSLPVRADLADDLRHWLADRLAALQAEARERGEPIPCRLPGGLPLFTVPGQLVKILDRDLQAAGIPKRDDRGRTLDVHALRTTFGTLLSKGGVSPRTAQAAMRHSDIKLTMGVYTDPRLLDVAGALDALPKLPLDAASAPGRTAGRTSGRTNG